MLPKSEKVEIIKYKLFKKCNLTDCKLCVLKDVLRLITLPLSMVVKFLFWINKFVYMRPGHMWNNNNLSIFSGTDKKFLWSVVRRLKAVSTGANIVKFRSIRFSLWSRPVICNNRVKVDKPNFWTVMNGPSSKESSNSYWNQEIEVYI